MKNLEKLANLALPTREMPTERQATTVVKEQNCFHNRERAISLKTQSIYHDRSVQYVQYIICIY